MYAMYIVLVPAHIHISIKIYVLLKYEKQNYILEAEFVRETQEMLHCLNAH